MRQGELSVILLTFIKLPFVIKIFVLSIFEWPFYTGLLYLQSNLGLRAVHPHINPKYIGDSQRSTLANNKDQDEMPYNVPFHQGLHSQQR